MGLFKRGSTWWVDFYVGGVRFQESTGTKNRKLAEKVAQKLKEDANLSRFQIKLYDPKLNFNTLAEKFKDSKPNAYSLDRLKHLSEFFQGMPVRDISKTSASEYRQGRKEQKPNLKDSTLNKDLGVLRHMLYWAVEQQLISSNPLARVQMVRERRVKRPVLSVAEEKLLLAAAPKHLRSIVIAGLDTGMRRGELLAQRWEDVDLERKLLFVTHSKTPEGESREIPLTKRTYELLLSMKHDSGLIFTYSGNQIKDLKTSWRTALKKSGIRHVRFHDLRHTFNTRLMEAGVISDVRKALMGHADNSVHYVYTHVELPAKRQAIQKLERWIKHQRS